ncbi:MAG: helicase [Microbacteriaceae bacterium]|nr:helicase [Microbacteriaceae bacterium]
MGRLGFEGGDVLEPGSGSGTFIGMAPESARMVGVELDSTTAAISRRLYPHADIRAESFADTRFPRGHFDAAVGNVPFADVALHDRQFNAGGHSMHNHFIIKSLAMTRPGGIVAVLTSRFTLDGTNPAARREMASMADLVGAVRLPSGAHRRAAGTEAVTDLLILRRRAEAEPARDDYWTTTVSRVVDGENVRVNGYFEAHPEHVLGEYHVGTGMHGAQTLTVRADDLGLVAGNVDAALQQITRSAQERGLVFTERSPEAAAERDRAAATQTELWDGTIVEGVEGFQIAKGGRLEPFAVPKTQMNELRGLIALRDGARELLEAESADLDDTPEIEALRTSLRRTYERYTARFGPINRFTLRSTGRYAKVLDPETGEVRVDGNGDPLRGDEILARVTPRAVSMMKQDPFGALVMALERFDDEEQTAAPATLLTERVLVPRVVKEGAETPAEAIALSLDRTGGVDLPLIANLLGVDEDEARAALGDLVYDDPTTGALEHAPAYLSGNIAVKLDAAIAAAEDDARFQANVDALRKVLPDPLGADEIEARMGAVWISPEVHQEFLRDILRDRYIQVESPIGGSWKVTGTRNTVLASNEWGTARRSAIDLAEAVMEQRPIQVFDTVDGPDGKTRRVFNPVETTAAQEKAEALQERFSEWVWEDPARAAELTGEYNRRFNSIALRDYASAGEYLTFPGLAATLTLRKHQRAAVARMIAEPAVGLFHQVGAGKTLEMIVGVTEMKRMGLISKPAIVVPNHMLEQFSREWLQAYPQARILTASSEDLAGEKRRLFIARAAANDWDGIVFTHSSFERVGVDPESQAAYLESEMDIVREAVENARQNGGMTVKQMEKQLLAEQEKIKKVLDRPRDPGVTLEASGIDYLAVDEAHLFKNLATVSNIPGAAVEGSGRANDLHLKLQVLRERNGGRVGVMATATPLANSVTEAHIMQRFLRPDLLEEAGVKHFDAWAATFGSQVTEMEMGPAGGFRVKTRFAKFQNVPEMLRMWHVFADVKTAEDLDLEVPQIAPRSDGERQPETVVIQPTPELVEFIGDIAERAEKVANRQVQPDEDNMLLISTDGRKAALDLRLFDQHAEQTGQVKLDYVAERILTEWRRTQGFEYLDDVTGEPSPRRGGLQLVFSDLGTPNERRWDAYTELKSKLIEGGMAPDQVRFMHDARNDSEKARLFAAARSGHIAVLIGSTSKMGVGTNVQARITAMHHVDCPWRPADLEQRDGRGIRQANQNPEVGIYRYVVERSFDAYSWQTVSRKAAFIAQVMKGRLDSREIEDIGDTALSATEAKALASGNPLVLEKATADNELAKLRRQETAHHRSKAALRFTRDNARTRLEADQAALAQLHAAADRTVDVTGDSFRMAVGGRVYGSRTDAADAIGRWAADHHGEWVTSQREGGVPLGECGGHTVTVRLERVTVAGFRTESQAHVRLEGVPYSGHNLPVEEFQNAGVGLVRAIENKTTAIAKSIARVEASTAAAREAIEDAEARLDAPFKHAAALEAAAQRAADVTAALEASAAPPDPAGERPAPADVALAGVASPAPGHPHETPHGGVTRVPVEDLQREMGGR